MQEMTASEFVSMSKEDKVFLVEICKNIPDEMLQEEVELPEEAKMGFLMDHYYYPASQAMGYEFDAAEFAAECDRQFATLEGFKKLKYFGRFFKSLRKAGKMKKKK